MHPQGASARQEASRLTRTPEGLVYTGETLSYRITGLTPYNLDRLRVTLKASSPDQKGGECPFHIDTVDLYHSRSREQFAESCTKYLKAQQTAVMTDLSQLIAVLEAERLLCELPFTRKELREETGWSETQVRRNIDHLVELGYIGRINGRHGSTFRYVLLDTGEDDPTVELRMSELESEGWNTRTGRGRSESGGKKGKNEKSTSYV